MTYTRVSLFGGRAMHSKPSVSVGKILTWTYSIQSLALLLQRASVYMFIPKISFRGFLFFFF